MFVNNNINIGMGCMEAKTSKRKRYPDSFKKHCVEYALKRLKQVDSFGRSPTLKNIASGLEIPTTTLSSWMKDVRINSELRQTAYKSQATESASPCNELLIMFLRIIIAVLKDLKVIKDNPLTI
ncbi:hypothetical protein [Dongshaea marina]|uniref:hypothetical protein n=1 Tax=Dongshaea marina TaxID=2047966 RepID=UPI000D3EDB92|nr:hypothetical protein [Dongshaea marina]